MKGKPIAYDANQKPESVIGHETWQPPESGHQTCLGFEPTPVLLQQCLRQSPLLQSIVEKTSDYAFARFTRAIIGCPR